MKVISHSADADGRLSAFLVAKKYKLVDLNDFIMMDYGDGNESWLSRISPDEDVVICDFGFQHKTEDMKKLLEVTKNVIWIDHHESTINDYGEMEKEIPGLRVNGTAACMLTYIYFYILGEKDERIIGKRIELSQETCEKLYSIAPLIVQYVHDNDVWRYDFGKKTECIKLALDAIGISSPLDPRWEDMFENKNNIIDEMISNGEKMISFRDSIGDNACKSYGFEVDLCGWHGFALNNTFGGSPWFGDRQKQYDFTCAFCYQPKTKTWEYSFYVDPSKDANAFKIAQSINPEGGGHKGAAGCISDKFIF